MPTPKDGESQKEFVSRCIQYLIHEGKHPNTPKGRRAAAGECYGIYRSSKKSDDEIAKCVKCGLKDAKGYFCRYNKDGEKFYYDINDASSKQLAKSQAEEFGLNILISNMAEEEIKQEPVKPSGNTDEEPREEEPGEERVESYSIPKSKDEISKGTIINYKGKIGKVVKVINT